MESLSELEAYLAGNWLTDLANFSAYLFHKLPGLNWVGFYLDYGDKLRLGPFVGKPACTEIAYRLGVCGAAFSRRETILVEDVREFPGHIACDSVSRSEMVLPVCIDGNCLGVLDLDSPEVGRFTSADRKRVEEWLALLLRYNPKLAAKPWA